MKKILLFTISALTLALVGCNNDHTYGYSSMGTVQQLSGFYILLDNDKLVKPNGYYSSMATGSRVLVQFRYDKIKDDSSSYYADVDLFDIYSVLTKDIVTMTSQNESYIGNDSFFSIMGMNCNGGYLNVYMKFAYGYIPHLINMVVNETDGTTTSTSGVFNLELRQNANNDSKVIIIPALASFSLESIREEMTSQGISEATINVSVNLGGSTDQVFTLTYNTDSDTDTAFSIDDDAIFDSIDTIE